MLWIKKWWKTSKQKAPRKKDRKYKSSKTNKSHKFINKLRNSLEEDLIRYIRIALFLLIYYTFSIIILKQEINWDIVTVVVFADIFKNMSSK